MIQILAGGALALFYWLIRPALDRRRWRAALDLSRTGLVWAGLGIGVMLLLFDPRILPILVAAILVHEYGHVLAYRLAGHPAPKFRIAPFGGVAMSGQAHRSEAESAFVALMGPGVSLALLVAAAAAHDAAAGVAPEVALYALQAAALIGLLNAFNLLPVYPLDGGHVLAALASLAGATAQLVIVIGAAIGCVALGVRFGLPLLAVIAGIGLAMALRRTGRPSRLRPMTPAEAAVTLGAYAACTAAHLIAAKPYLEALGLLARRG